MSDQKTVRCTDCAAEFTDAEIEHCNACPTCGSAGVPCAIANDVTIKINWHELRILGLWAEFHASTFKPGQPGDGSKRTLDSILKRLEAQHPGKAPLSLKREVQQMSNEFGAKAELRQGGKVTTFEPEPKS